MRYLPIPILLGGSLMKSIVAGSGSPIVYFITGMFMPLILGMVIGACVAAEAIRAATKYRSFVGIESEAEGLRFGF